MIYKMLEEGAFKATTVCKLLLIVVAAVGSSPLVRSTKLLTTDYCLYFSGINSGSMGGSLFVNFWNTLGTLFWPLRCIQASVYMDLVCLSSYLKPFLPLWPSFAYVVTLGKWHKVWSLVVWRFFLFLFFLSAVMDGTISWFSCLSARITDMHCHPQ